mmetsp:Transcript_22020/g.31962  ORF Transcript_22020/g.31962 Transcript_22020/m.31962 type:complete len:229 (-) Transcript_22020:578-1264(-)
MPMVPKLDPQAKDVAKHKTETRAGSKGADTYPEVRVEERNSAVPTSDTTCPRAQASTKTNWGSSTSFIPSIHASITSPRLRNPCAVTRMVDTRKPPADAQSSALTESQLLNRSITLGDTGWSWGGRARRAEAPSASMPAMVATITKVKGSTALIQRRGVPALGSSGPGSGTGPASTSKGSFPVGFELGGVEASAAATTFCSASTSGPNSRPSSTLSTTMASSNSGKKR